MIAFKTMIKRIINWVVPVRGRGNIVRGINLRKVQIVGNNNIIKCAATNIGSVKIRIFGNNNNKIIISENVIMKSGLLWIEDNGNEIEILENTTIEGAELAVAEGCKILIGKDCMFSSDIRIATTDSHSIIDMSTGERTNRAKDVVIEDHVWLGKGVSVNKGVVIKEGTIISGNSVVTKSCETNCVYAGIPATLKKQNVSWSRKRI